MKQNFNEIEVLYVLPNVRREIVIGLLKKGLSQNKIAEKLGLRKSTISQYVNKKRGKEVKFDDNMKEIINTAVQNILKNKDPHIEIMNVCSFIIKTKTVCDIHRMYENVPLGCEVCIK